MECRHFRDGRYLQWMEVESEIGGCNEPRYAVVRVINKRITVIRQLYMRISFLHRHAAPVNYTARSQTPGHCHRIVITGTQPAGRAEPSQCDRRLSCMSYLPQVGLPLPTSGALRLHWHSFTMSQCCGNWTRPQVKGPPLAKITINSSHLYNAVQLMLSAAVPQWPRPSQKYTSTNTATPRQTVHLVINFTSEIHWIYSRYCCIFIWRSSDLPSDVTSAPSLVVFGRRLKTELFRRCYNAAWLFLTLIVVLKWTFYLGHSKYFAWLTDWLIQCQQKSP